MYISFLKCFRARGVNLNTTASGRRYSDVSERHTERGQVPLHLVAARILHPRPSLLLCREKCLPFVNWERAEPLPGCPVAPAWAGPDAGPGADLVQPLEDRVLHVGDSCPLIFV